MRVLTMLLLGVLLLVGCAGAVPVTLTWTNPALNQAGLNLCTAGADSCRDLAAVRLYGQELGRSDSTLVATKLVPRRLGLPDSATVDVAGDRVWTFWGIAVDSLGYPSCRSGTTTKDLRTPPTAPALR